MWRWIALLLSLMLIVLQFKLWDRHGGMREVEALHAAIAKQQGENDKLSRRNQALAADVEDLKEGEQAIEARARSELGLIKPGEVFYQVVDRPVSASGDLPPSAPPGGSGGH
jgi:cell division protein FtsB